MTSIAKYLKKIMILCFFGFVALCLPYFIVEISSNNVIYHQITQLPKSKPLPVAVVLGCSPKYRGKANPFFTYRMTAIAQLWHAGKIARIIVSGDNSTKFYNEPKQMYQALIKHGIPAKNITMDKLGTSTFASMQQLRKNLPVNTPIIIVSQKFHIKRAIFIAHHAGLHNIIGYVAKNVNSRNRRMQIRELFARIKMLKDCYIDKPNH